jgi:hypothetical protein
MSENMSLPKFELGISRKQGRSNAAWSNLLSNDGLFCYHEGWAAGWPTWCCTRSLQLLWMHKVMFINRSRTESSFLPLFLDARRSPTHPSCPRYRPTMHHLDRFCFIRLDGFLSSLTSLCSHWNTA